MRHALIAAAVLASGAATSAATAQDACGKHFTLPPVGRWAEYQSRFKTDSATMRYAVIGTEKREGQDLTWIEMRMRGKDKKRSGVYQMLVPGYPYDPAGVQEMVFQPGDGKPMKVSGMMLKMVRSGLEKGGGFKLSEACKEVTLVGEEKISVPAGTFTTWRFRSDKYETDSWVSADVPFAMIRSLGKDHEMVLAGQGDGAKSSITETPQEMPGLGGK